VIVELSTGHVFVAESVKAVTALTHSRENGFGLSGTFEVVGVGYRVKIEMWESYPEEAWKLRADDAVLKAAVFESDRKMQLVRLEFIDKLLGPRTPAPQLGAEHV
jgi:hypothetical protein